MESSLVIELKITGVDTSYFVGLTSTENSQIQFGKVTRWIQIGDEARYMTNSKNIAQKRHSSFIMDGRTVSIKVHSLYLLLQVTFALSHVCIKHGKQNLG